MKETPFPKYAALMLGGFIVGVLLMVVAQKALAPSEEMLDTPNDSTEMTQETNGTDTPMVSGMQDAFFTVAGQAAGSNVVVTNVEMPEDGWLVVHEVSDGHVGNALGAARRDKGSYDSVNIELLRGTTPGSEYMVVLYADNGNKVFELKTDLPVVNTNGDPVMHAFTTSA